MMNYQQALSRLITPADSMRTERRSHPAFVQIFPSAAGKAPRVTTYADMQSIIEQASAEIAEVGVMAGSHVLLCSSNSPELVAAILACWRLGASAIPVDFRLTDGEVNNIAQRVGATAVYAPGRKLEGDFKTLTGDWSRPSRKTIPPAAVAAEKPALAILTSGTTGMPKGALHDLQSLINNIVELGGAVGLGEHQSVLLPLPVSHIFGLEVTLSGMIYGGTTCFADFVPAEFPGYIMNSKPTIVVGVPTIYGALTNMPVPPTLFQDVDICLCGGAPLPVSLAQEFQAKFNKRITQGYGSTEAKIICINIDGPVNSIGHVVPSTRIEAVDAADNPLPEGETGELRITGPTLMLGYMNQPEATQSVLHDGHFHTGDIGHIRDGYVYISGRSKEMIIVAGNKIFPSEVEDVLRKNPLAGEVAVVGVPHSRLGQLVKAIIVVPPGDFTDRLCSQDIEAVKVAREELEAHFREQAKNDLKRELRPMSYEFRPSCDPLPKTNTGKIDKKQLAPA